MSDKSNLDKPTHPANLRDPEHSYVTRADYRQLNDETYTALARAFVQLQDIQAFADSFDDLGTGGYPSAAAARIRNAHAALADVLVQLGALVGRLEMLDWIAGNVGGGTHDLYWPEKVPPPEGSAHTGPEQTPAAEPSVAVARPPAAPPPVERPAPQGLTEQKAEVSP